MPRMLCTSFLLLLLSWNVPKLTAQEPGDEPPEAAGDAAADLQRVVPVFDPGSHTRPICGIGFTPDKSKLITVGEDFSIQVWSTSTGERLDILRLPPFGHEEGDRHSDWDIAAISNDGRYVAVGGGLRRTHADKSGKRTTSLVLVDVSRRAVRPVAAPPGRITALAFSPDGNRLAASIAGKSREIQIFTDLDAAPARPRRRRGNVVLTDPRDRKNPYLLTFSPDGSRLLASGDQHDVNVWDVSPGQSRLLHSLELPGVTKAIAWSADGKRFARAWSDFHMQPHGFEIRLADGSLVKAYEFGKTAPFGDIAYPWHVSFLDPETLLLHTFDGRATAEPGAMAVRFDLKTGQGRALLGEAAPGKFPVLGVLSQDHELAAMTVSMGLDAVIYRVRDGAMVSRCGADSPIPTVVGWAVQGRPQGFAWSETPQPGRHNTDSKDLEVGFDLTRMEPVARLNPADYGVLRLTAGEFSLSHVKGEDGANEFNVLHNGQAVGNFRSGNSLGAMTLVPQGAAPPLVAWSALRTQRGSAALTLSKPDGKRVRELYPHAVHVRDIAPSSDGRFFIASTGTHRLCVYRTEGSAYPLINVARVRGEWVAWSGEGYYTASPGGEKMIGWAVSNGPDQLATFHTAEKFARHFRRPDLLQRAVELGSLEAALKRVETRSPSIEQLLPPRSELTLVKQAGNRLQIRAVATSGAKDKPVVALRLLLDGRPLAGGVGYKVLKPGETAEATWDIDIPSGQHELKLMARSDDGAEVSEPMLVTGGKSAEQQPVLHRLCVGINKYDQSALDLTSAAKDAVDVFGALEKYCVGSENRFGTVQGVLLTDKQATRAAVLQAIGNIRKSAKPGDLVVFLFAGHGVKQQDEYYLLTREANPAQSLLGHALSGADLRKELDGMECSVLLMLDACHSARGVKSFRPATDDLTRNLTDDSAGVTVLAAAMSHEVASATEENGHFTAAVLKALQLGPGVPFDPDNHVLYTHHLYSVVFSEVRKATNGRQNPFLNMPWTVPPLAIRDVPKR